MTDDVNLLWSAALIGFMFGFPANSGTSLMAPRLVPSENFRCCKIRRCRRQINDKRQILK